MRRVKEHIISTIGRADWPLLLFIAGITYSKIYVKLAAIALYSAYQLYRRYAFPKKIVSAGWFYLLMPPAGLLSAAVQGSFRQPGYPMVAAWGTLLWCIAGVAFYLLYTRVHRGDNEKIHAAVKLFFIANLVMSLAQLVHIMLESGSPVPYWYYDKADVYGASTGDYITGIFGGASVTNGTISAIGAIWYLCRRNIGMAVVCICAMMLCTSNITIACFLFVCMVMVVTVKTRRLRFAAISLFVLSTGLYILLSPANIWYIEKTWNKFFGPKAAVAITTRPDFNGHFYLQDVPDSVYSHYRTALVLLKQSSAADTARHNLAVSKNAVSDLMQYWYGMPAVASPLAFWNKPGKLYAFRQTANFMATGPIHMLAGAGMANFSSKMALKATGSGIEGHFPESKIYVSKDYMQAHLYTTLYYFAQPAVAHSMMNMPNSVYNQLAGEYGIAGLVLFACLYVGFFIRERRRLRAGRYLLPALLLFFGYEYWFEMISLTVIFELLSLTDIFSNEVNEGKATSACHGIDAGL